MARLKNKRKCLQNKHTRHGYRHGMAAARDDVLGSLRALRRLRDDYAASERREVARARNLGISCRDIGDALGRNPSALWQKYNDETG
jgi:hypothetical protein